MLFLVFGALASVVQAVVLHPIHLTTIYDKVPAARTLSCSDGDAPKTIRGDDYIQSFCAPVPITTSTISELNCKSNEKGQTIRVHDLWESFCIPKQAQTTHNYGPSRYPSMAKASITTAPASITGSAESYDTAKKEHHHHRSHHKEHVKHGVAVGSITIIMDEAPASTPTSNVLPEFDCNSPGQYVETMWVGGKSLDVCKQGYKTVPKSILSTVKW